MDDDTFNWNRDGEQEDTKYPYIIHAEVNAILNSNSSVKNCILYTNKFPCNECAKVIIQSGIIKVIYKGEIPDKPLYQISVEMLEKAKITIEKY